MIDSGSQDVQVESESEPDNDDTPDPSDRDANEKDQIPSCWGKWNKNSFEMYDFIKPFDLYLIYCVCN